MESNGRGTKKKTKESEPTFSDLLPPWPEWNDAEINAMKWEVSSPIGSRSGEKEKLANPG